MYERTETCVGSWKSALLFTNTHMMFRRHILALVLECPGRITDAVEPYAFWLWIAAGCDPNLASGMYQTCWTRTTTTTKKKLIFFNYQICSTGFIFVIGSLRSPHIFTISLRVFFFFFKISQNIILLLNLLRKKKTHIKKQKQKTFSLVLSNVISAQTMLNCKWVKH